MYINLKAAKITKDVADANLQLYLKKRAGRDEDVVVSNNNHICEPNMGWYVTFDLHNLQREFYINGIKRVYGSFENVTFKRGTFFDESYFKNVVFKDCYFDDIDIRWCHFENCKFINCTGNVKYMRVSTLKKGCVFQDSHITVGQVDQYIWVNGKRYDDDHLVLESL